MMMMMMMLTKWKKRVSSNFNQDNENTTLNINFVLCCLMCATEHIYIYIIDNLSDEEQWIKQIKKNK